MAKPEKREHQEQSKPVPGWAIFVLEIIQDSEYRNHAIQLGTIPGVQSDAKGMFVNTPKGTLPLTENDVRTLDQALDAGNAAYLSHLVTNGVEEALDNGFAAFARDLERSTKPVVKYHLADNS